VDLQDIEGASLAIRRVIATGAGVMVEGATLSGDITIEDVQAGGSGGPVRDDDTFPKTDDSKFLTLTR
jgi:hypothetical protein